MQLTVRSVRARAVNVPLARPVRTAVGDVPTAPLVLIDVDTHEGIHGRSYIFGYTDRTLGALVRLITDIGPELTGKSVAPAERMRGFDRRFKLLGWQGLVGMVVGGLDMALWDALGRAAGLPVVTLLGGEPKPLPAYDSYGVVDPAEDGPVLEKAVARGFRGIKIKLAGRTADDDVKVVREVREIIGPDVALLSVRRKLKPTHAERTIYGEGDGSDIQVHETRLGRLGALNCAENMHPLTKYTMFSKGEQIHVASWPSFSVYRGKATALGPEVNTAVSMVYAVEGQTFVLAPCATVGQAAQDLFCDTDAKKELLLQGGGFTRIHGPEGSELAKPLPETEEGLLYADLDFALLAIAKNAYDPVGHYSRPDVFSLTFNPNATHAVQHVGPTGDAPVAGPGPATDPDESGTDMAVPD